MEFSFSKINPRNKMVVIKPYQSENVSESGLVIEHASNTAGGRVRGEIIELAPDCSSDLKVGQTVLFRRYSTDELKYMSKHGEEMVLLVHDSEILAVPDPTITA